MTEKTKLPKSVSSAGDLCVACLSPVLIPCPRLMLTIDHRDFAPWNLCKARQSLTRCSSQLLPIDPGDFFSCSPRFSTSFLSGMVKKVTNGKTGEFFFDDAGQHFRKHLGAFKDSSSPLLGPFFLFFSLMAFNLRLSSTWVRALEEVGCQGSRVRLGEPAGPLEITVVTLSN